MLKTLLDTVEKALDDFEFSAAAQLLYAFFWGDFCDWYVEVSKSKLQDDSARDNCLAIQDLCLRQILLLLHPYMPFITEELWHKLGYGADDSFIQNVNPGNGEQLLHQSSACVSSFRKPEPLARR